jgi:hypothetical protein
MKKITFMLLALIAAVSANAQLDGSNSNVWDD